MIISKLKKTGIILLSSLTLFSLVGCNQTTEKDSKILSSPVFKTIQTTDIKGARVDSSIFSKNKLTLVNIWNTGCTPCVDEIPILDKLNNEYESKGVSIKGLVLESGVGLNEQERKSVSEVINKSKASYQQLITSKELFESDVLKDIDSFPTTFFVDKDGNILDKISGANDYDGWKTEIESILKRGNLNE